VRRHRLERSTTDTRVYSALSDVSLTDCAGAVVVACAGRRSEAHVAALVGALNPNGCASSRYGALVVALHDITRSRDRRGWPAHGVRPFVPTDFRWPYGLVVETARLRPVRAEAHAADTKATPAVPCACWADEGDVHVHVRTVSTIAAHSYRSHRQTARCSRRRTGLHRDLIDLWVAVSSAAASGW